MGIPVKCCWPVLLVMLCCGVNFLHQAEGKCSSLSNKFVTVDETTPSGYLLFNITKESPPYTTTFIVKNKNLTQDEQEKLKGFFRLNQTDSYFYMEINQTLDLELLHTDYHAVLTDIILGITCGGTTSYEVTIIIRPVNEFPPVFVGAPYNVTVNEALPVASSVFNFASKVTDRDIPQPSSFFFGVPDYLIKDLDGKEYFEFLATTKGELSVKKPLDYDHAQRKQFVLNVSVADGNGPGSKMTFATLRINITDADDQKPYFDFPNCGTPCVAPPYQAIVSETQTGPLVITPAPIAAKDDDTLGTKLLFSIEGDNFGGMFTIDENTGAMRQTKSVQASGLLNGEFRLIIQVRKDTPTDLSAIAILSVRVIGRLPNATDPVIPPEQNDDTSSASTSLLIPVIILGILLALLIAAIVVVFLLMRRKQKRMMISPETDRSEPQTEEEEIHDTDKSQQEYNQMADINEKLVFGNKTTRAVETDRYPVPAGKAGQLPPLPLRDSATETTEVKKKKRTRKRNRNKEPEIFDGTREYNMGLDADFFADSTDKSRIKRSQRSKKADSTLPINVPNDQPAETDYENHVMHM